MRGKGTIRQLLALIAAGRARVAGAVGCAVAVVAASLAGPLLIGRVIDRLVGPDGPDAGLLGGIGVLGGVYALYSLALWGLTVLSNRIAYQAAHTLRQRLFRRLNLLPLRFFDTIPHGDTVTRFVNDVDAVSEGLLQSVSTLITGALTILGATMLMYVENPVMATVVLLSAPASYFVARFVTLHTQRYYKAQARTVGGLNGFAEETFSGARTAQAFRAEPGLAERFGALNRELYEVGVKAQFYSSLTNPSTRLVNNLAYALVGLVGALLAVQGDLTVGGISSFLLYANLFAKPFNEITGVLTQLQSALASANRIFRLLEEPEELPEPPGARVLAGAAGAVTFAGVSFSYEPEKPLIRDFNLRVEPGSRIAIVGTTGAGKTTLINLLMRFYDVDAGDIQVDGESIYRTTRDSLRRSFGMVLQDTWLFGDTIRANIAYGKPEATEAEIQAAAERAGAHSFIRRLPQGYDTPILGGGENLSQGQRQLLTIARAMLTDPPMLILDEATSSIDTRTEARIQRAFKRMMAGKTSFVIAHRLSTIRDADRILVLEQGNVVESGTHEELLTRGGAYARLYNSQFAGAEGGLG